MSSLVHNQIQIVNYQDQFKVDFEKLNRAWLEKYFQVEPIDEEIFRDPDSYILNKGGYIFFALLNDIVVGTCALIKKNDTYELAKMAVSEEHQGAGIGKALLIHALNKSKGLGVKYIELVSNRKLIAALHIYKKAGFKEVPISEEYKQKYSRCDIHMIYEF